MGGNKGTDPGQFNYPVGIAIDLFGNVYVADTGNNRIQKFSNTGELLYLWGGSGSEEGKFFKPEGIAVNNNGDVFVADGGNNRVQRFAMLNIKSTSVSNGAPNTSLTINGTAFSSTPGENIVTLNGIPCSVTSVFRKFPHNYRPSKFNNWIYKCYSGRIFRTEPYRIFGATAEHHLNPKSFILGLDYSNNG